MGARVSGVDRCLGSPHAMSSLDAGAYVALARQRVRRGSDGIRGVADAYNASVGAVRESERSVGSKAGASEEPESGRKGMHDDGDCGRRARLGEGMFASALLRGLSLVPQLVRGDPLAGRLRRGAQRRPPAVWAT